MGEWGGRGDSMVTGMLLMTNDDLLAEIDSCFIEHFEERKKSVISVMPLRWTCF